MKSSTLAFLALVAGLIAGAALGVLLGSSSADPAYAADSSIGRGDSVERGSTSVERSAPNRLASVSEGTRPGVAITGGDDGLDRAAGSASRAVAARVEATVAADVAESTWTGVITGVAVDVNGAPLEHVTVVSGNTPSSSRYQVSGRSTKGVGRAYAGPKDLDEQLESRAKSILKSKKLRRVTTTDAEGRFRLEGLQPGEHRLSGYLEGLVFSSATVMTGDSGRLVGTEVTAFELDFRLPDGTQPESVLMLRTSNRSSATYEWSPEEPTFRTKLRAVSFTAYAGNITRPDYRAYVSDFESAETSLDADLDGLGPHTIELKTRRVLRVTVDDQSTLQPRVKPWVKLLTGNDAAATDITPLLEDAQSLSRGKDSVYLVADVVPGPALIAAGRGDIEAEVTAKVEIVEGVTEVSLVLGEVDMERFLVVNCVGPSQRPLMDVSFQFRAQRGGSSSSGGATAIAREPGVYWIAMSELTNDKEWTDELEVTLTASSSAYGSLTKEISRSQGSIDLKFQASCELVVHMDGDLSPGFRVAATALTEEDDAGQKARRYSRDSKAPDADGNVRFSGLQPGRMVVALRKGNNSNNWSEPVAWEEIVLQAGSNELSMQAPTFHDVVIYAPDMDEGDDFWLQIDKGDANTGYFGGNSVSLDENLRATFKDVAAGNYIVQSWGSGQQLMKISVPTGEVVFEAEKINAYIAQGVESGKLADKAGIREGDIVIGIDGEAIDGDDFYQALWLGLRKGTVSLALVRGGQNVNATVGPAEKPKKAWEEMGVNWMPTSR